MTLSEFIEANMERLLKEWEEFARRAQPPEADLDRDELRDWAEGLLKAIASEMRTPDSDAELERKSRRLRPADAPEVTKAAHFHALDRLTQGFNLNQMISEYRALRTSISLHWRQESGTDDARVGELVRFDEALDQALAESIRRYSETLEHARDLFVGALGHDMRTPLSSILVSAEALLMSPDELGIVHLQGAVRIRNAAKRITDMLQDLLDFTHTRLGGRLPISRESMDLRSILTGVAEELRVIHPHRNIHVDCDAPLDGEFDAQRIAQLLSNVISNAIKYGRADTPVGVHAEKEGDEIVITIHNEGDPIPRDQQRTIFEPLVRGQGGHEADRKKPEAGLGLGLYIAKEIAEAHGGHVTLRSSTAESTIFEVRLARSSGKAAVKP